MNPKTSTVSALTTSEYRYCASSGVSPLKPPNEVRPLLPSTPLSATAAIRPSVRSINSARCAGSLAIPSAASTSAVSSSSQRRSVVRDLLQLAVQPQPGERRQRRHRPPDEHDVEPSRAVEAQLVEIAGRNRIGDLVDAVAHDDGRALELAEPRQPCVRVRRAPVRRPRRRTSGRAGGSAGGPARRRGCRARATPRRTRLIGPTARRPWSCRSRPAPTRASPGRRGTRRVAPSGGAVAPRVEEVPEFRHTRGTRAYQLHWARQPHRGGSVRRSRTGRETSIWRVCGPRATPRATAQCARSRTDRSDLMLSPARLRRRPRSREPHVVGVPDHRRALDHLRLHRPERAQRDHDDLGGHDLRRDPVLPRRRG